jgi:hypothetical protein
MRFLTLTVTLALSGTLLAGSQAALAAPRTSCTVDHRTAPFLASTGPAARVTGSVAVVTGRGTTRIDTPGVTAGRSAQPRVSAGQALVAFCVRSGSVTSGASLLTVTPGGLSVLATTPRSLTMAGAGSRVRPTGPIALSPGPQLVQVLLDRSHQRASLLLDGSRRAIVTTTIAATTTISIGSPGHPSAAGTVVISLAGTPPSKTAAPIRPPAAPRTTTSSTSPAHAVSTVVTPPPATTTTTASTPRPTTATTTLGITAAQASNVPFNPFSPTSFWNAPTAAAAPLAANSQTMVNDLASQVTTYGSWLNTTKYSIPAYVVPADQPTVGVHLTSWGPDLQLALNAVPIPPGAKPAAGGDESLTVWQPSTDKLWDFWGLTQSTTGAWSTKWGGEMDNVSTNPGYFTHLGQSTNWGGTGTGLPLLGGLVTIADLNRGYIDHALAIAIPMGQKGVFAWPAQRSDGGYTGGVAIPEGTMFRLDPTVNIASLNLPYLDRLLAQAAQTYGIVVRDQSGCVSFYAQDPTTTGSNPWAPLFGKTDVGTYIGKFPWSHLQALQAPLTTTP